jgi:hypothetical protein
MCGQLTNQNSLDPIKYSKLNLEVVKYAIKKIRKTRLWLFSIILNKVRESERNKRSIPYPEREISYF